MAIVRDRSLGADVVRTSECGYAASKRPPSRSLLYDLADDEPWRAALDAFRARHPRRAERAADYQRLIDAGEHRRIAAAVLASSYVPAPPAEAWLNKLDGRKKRLFRYRPADELLFRAVNRLLQPPVARAMSPWCRSFLPGGGARAAFRSLLADPALGDKSAVRLDVRDYFNSIDVDDLLRRLPEHLADDALMALLGASLRDRRVVRGGAVVDGGRKGVMAGTPIAPLLATLYLDDVDREVVATGATYARYSDDILVLAAPRAVADTEALLRDRLAQRGLTVNESKSARVGPGMAWDFLGFRYAAGAIDLAPVTERKFRARTTRLARGLLRWRERNGASPERALGTFVRRTNRRQYGVPGEPAHFSWATWFLPMLATDSRLAALDTHVVREARYAAIGRRTPSARSVVPYRTLTDAGYLPLVAAYWARREGSGAYDTLVARRTGLER